MSVSGLTNIIVDFRKNGTPKNLVIFIDGEIGLCYNKTVNFRMKGGRRMKYDSDRAAITLSVGELCARAVCSPDLDLRMGGGPPSAERAAIGREAHKLLQARAGEGYEAEVALSCTTLYGGVCYEVSGRADLLLCRGTALVEEIKTVSGRGFDRAPTPLHEAQAMCYAHFLCKRDGLSEVEVRLTLCRTEDSKTRCFARICSARELEDYYLFLLSRVAYLAKFLVERHTVRLPSAEGSRFPFSSVRDGQELMMKECYRDLRAGKRLFVQAPTGTGKTISALYPAVRALGEERFDKIFYLTAKASTRREAYAASAKLFEAGAKLYTVVLTSREQICASEAAKNDPAGISRHCNPADCPRAKGFFEKCPAALAELTERQNGFPRASIEQICEKHGICPYEFQLSLSELCDVVICDYNYAFDPLVYLRRYFEPEAVDANRYAFLVDEVHNLGDRACDMYTASVPLSQLRAAYRSATAGDEAAEQKLRPLWELIVTQEGMRRLCADNLFKDEDGVERGYYISKNQMLSFDQAVMHARGAIEKHLFGKIGVAGETELTCLSGLLKRYETISMAYDSQFITFVEVEGEEITVRQICLDPSRVLDAALNRARAAILFSATLTPIDYFSDILGGGKNAVRISLPSPFDPQNQCITVATGVSARYEERDRSVKKIAARIAATVSARAGNYIAFFPSYDYMEKVHEAFRKRYPKVETVLQERGMSAAKRDRFLDAFADDDRLRVGFCVLGGSFSEGVDLPGRLLIGVMVIGVGLPGISNERNILKEYYDTTRERGFDYAYTFPGMNRVLQAAGRVIRREDDRGVIVLMDDRYAEPRYSTLFPEHWQTVNYARNATELANIITEFWSNSDKKAKNEISF